MRLKEHANTGRNAAGTRSAVERWVLSHLGTAEHERRVATLAAMLFDLTRARHGLGKEQRDLLHLAALVHDVGRSIEDDAHERHGCAMLMEDEALTFVPWPVRRAMAFLTRYHRGGVPEAGAEEVLLKEDERYPLRCLLALLRAADALDGRNVESPRVLFALRGRKLAIECFLAENDPKARRKYAVTRKYRMLEEMMGMQVSVEVSLARELRVAA